MKNTVVCPRLRGKCLRAVRRLADDGGLCCWYQIVFGGQGMKLDVRRT